MEEKEIRELAKIKEQMKELREQKNKIVGKNKLTVLYKNLRRETTYKNLVGNETEKKRQLVKILARHADLIASSINAEQ